MRDSSPNDHGRVIDPDLDHTDDSLNVASHPWRRRITLHRFVTVTLIGIGGGCGTLARWALESGFPVGAQLLPWTTIGINALGAGVLGAMLAWLTASGPDQGWRRRVRLTVGTGVIGGFTTYSAFSIETMGFLRRGQLWSGIAYAVLTLVVGLLAAGLGDRAMSAVLRRKPGEPARSEAQ